MVIYTTEFYPTLKMKSVGKLMELENIILRIRKTNMMYQILVCVFMWEWLCIEVRKLERGTWKKNKRGCKETDGEYTRMHDK